MESCDFATKVNISSKVVKSGFIISSIISTNLHALSQKSFHKTVYFSILWSKYKPYDQFNRPKFT